MLRVVLAAWYIVAAVVAPHVCCCDHHPTAEAAAAAAPACPHCPTASDDRTESPKPAPTPGKPTCPCKENHSHDAPAVVTAPHWAGGPDGATGYLVSDRPTRLAVPALAAAAGLGEVPRAGPFLTRDDLLRAFHILRC
jgi:hypothetical protein